MTAKGVEDTAFYVYNRLVSLNEVGGEPGRFGIQPEAVHAYNRDRQARWPYALSPAVDARHQAQRGRPRPDQRPVRDARGLVGRRGPLEPAQRTASAAPSPTTTSRSPTPTRSTSSTRRSSAPGRWSSDSGRGPRRRSSKRIQAYMLKALHEAKVHYELDQPQRRVRRGRPGRSSAASSTRTPTARSSTTSAPSSAGSAATACSTRCRRRCSSSRRPACRTRTRGPSCGTSAWSTRTTAGRWTTTAARGCSGSSGRPSSPPAATCASWPGTWSPPRKTAGSSSTSPTGRSPCRRDHPGLFTAGDYIPLAAEGPKAAHLFAFARRAGDAAAVVAVPRLVARLTPDPARPPLGAEAWSDTRLLLAGLDPATPLAQPLHRRGPDAGGPRRPALPGRGRRLRPLPRRPAIERGKRLKEVSAAPGLSLRGLVLRLAWVLGPRRRVVAASGGASSGPPAGSDANGTGFRIPGRWPRRWARATDNERGKPWGRGDARSGSSSPRDTTSGTDYPGRSSRSSAPGARPSRPSPCLRRSSATISASPKQCASWNVVVKTVPKTNETIA